MPALASWLNNTVVASISQLRVGNVWNTKAAKRRENREKKPGGVTFSRLSTLSRVSCSKIFYIHGEASKHQFEPLSYKVIGACIDVQRQQFEREE